MDGTACTATPALVDELSPVYNLFAERALVWKGVLSHWRVDQARCFANLLYYLRAIYLKSTLVLAPGTE